MLLAATCIFILTIFVAYVGIFHPGHFFQFTMPMVFIAPAFVIGGLIYFSICSPEYFSFCSPESSLGIFEILGAIFATWWE